MSLSKHIKEHEMLDFPTEPAVPVDTSTLLHIDGSNSMSGVLNTDTGKFLSTETVSTTKPAYSFVSDKAVFTTAANNGVQLFEVLDSFGAGLRVSAGIGQFGASDLVIENTKALFGNGLEFKLNGILGIVKFTDATQNISMGFRPAAGFMTVSIDQLGFDLQDSGNPEMFLQLGSLNPRIGGTGLGLGAANARWTDCYLGRTTASTLAFYGATGTTQPTALTAPSVAAPAGTDAAIIANLQTRLNELETKIQSLGLIA